ncbi:MAG: hypothetical protein P9M13_08045 [Candidatus Ancaeobacter aquaticus]|nr:hypothetical protein [Candidatus Ancaeobacter aquaticus]
MNSLRLIIMFVSIIFVFFAVTGKSFSDGTWAGNKQKGGWAGNKNKATTDRFANEKASNVWAGSKQDIKTTTQSLDDTDTWADNEPPFEPAPAISDGNWAGDKKDQEIATETLDETDTWAENEPTFEPPQAISGGDGNWAGKKVSNTTGRFETPQKPRWAGEKIRKQQEEAENEPDSGVSVPIDQQ